MGSVANFICYPAVQKMFLNRLSFDKVIAKVWQHLFLRHSVYTTTK